MQEKRFSLVETYLKNTRSSTGNNSSRVNSRCRKLDKTGVCHLKYCRTVLGMINVHIRNKLACAHLRKYIFCNLYEMNASNFCTGLWEVMQVILDNDACKKWVSCNTAVLRYIKLQYATLKGHCAVCSCQQLFTSFTCQFLVFLYKQ